MFGMNIIDPLWNNPKPTNRTSSPGGSPQSVVAKGITPVSSCLAESCSTFIAALSAREALSTTTASLSSGSCTGNCTTTSTNTLTSGLTLSDVNATIVTALAD